MPLARPLSIRLQPETLAAVRARARQERRSVVAMLRVLVEDALRYSAGSDSLTEREEAPR